MKKNRLLSSASFIIISLSSLSLIAAMPLPKEPSQSYLVHEEDTFYYSDAEEAAQDNTLMDSQGLITDNVDTDANLPFEEEDSNIEDQTKLPTDPNFKPDVHKVLYDTKMNYGTGAPIPKAAPITTVTRNLIVLGTSAVLATIAILVVGSNQGMNAPQR